MTNQGCATCRHCGATYRMFTIFDKNLQGLARAWRNRHEKKCAKRTPEQRGKWAKQYLHDDSSITVDLEHDGFKRSVLEGKS
jgi:hypothetical protein